MTMHNHPQARAEARHLVNRFDGSADKLVVTELEHKLDDGDVDEALRLDQVRREIEHLYAKEGK